eukprot:SAG22_NODE_2861_length_2149_cov_3.144878_1_plen_166_part_00
MLPVCLQNLFDLPAFLTKRDAWAGSFHELLTLDAPRADTPMHLPEAPPPHPGPCIAPCPPPAPAAAAAVADQQHQQRRSLRQHHQQQQQQPDDELSGRTPQHCSAATGQCIGVDAVTNKQRHMIQLYSLLTLSPAPDVDKMRFEDASRWIGARQSEWHAQGGPLR